MAVPAVGSYLPGVHAHNDYDQPRPLRDALELGFSSIEVDVALRDGMFYVTHDSSNVRSVDTLQDMYLEPLRVLAEANDGRIYALPAPPLRLLVDIKSDAGEAFDALQRELSGYPGLVTRWTGDTRTDGAVTIVVSGNRAVDRFREQKDRLFALDGRIWEDRTGIGPDVMPIVSINWDDTIGPGGKWHTSERLANARRMSTTVHREGRVVRFWGTPDSPNLWTELRARGVDVIGADDIRSLARYIRR